MLEQEKAGICTPNKCNLCCALDQHLKALSIVQEQVESWHMLVCSCILFLMSLLNILAGHGPGVGIYQFFSSQA